MILYYIPNLSGFDLYVCYRMQLQIFWEANGGDKNIKWQHLYNLFCAMIKNNKELLLSTPSTSSLEFQIYDLSVHLLGTINIFH